MARDKTKISNSLICNQNHLNLVLFGDETTLVDKSRRKSENMWQRLKLNQRIYIILAAIVVVGASTGLVTIWYSFRIEGMITTIIDSRITAFQSAEMLENALINQKGFVSYYFLDGDPAWLEKLKEYRAVFDQRMNEARDFITDPQSQLTLHKIDDQYRDYINLKDQIIEQYKAGQRSASTLLNQQARVRYFSILDQCEAYKNLQLEAIQKARQYTYVQINRLRGIVLSVTALGIILAAALALILVRQILNPITRLLQTTFSGTASEPNVKQNETNVVAALSQSVEGLIQNVDQTQSELAKSREHLLQAEKMAMVGKLAAGMAHSIRNPFTSVKMRLFSLGRALQMTSAQKEDFEVISEEIRHIDTIVQNFLEFSRPPKLVMQNISISTVIDNTLQLLSHRLKSYDVTIRLIRPNKLPTVSADPEQLKEVLVNLVINACEAFEQRGGMITIEEKVIKTNDRPNVMVRLSDTGPGVPSTIHEQLFQPFFTTKEDGTGLGLSIAQRIMEEHGGRLNLDISNSKGAAFILTLPVKESDSEYDSRY